MKIFYALLFMLCLSGSYLMAGDEYVCNKCGTRTANPVTGGGSCSSGGTHVFIKKIEGRDFFCQKCGTKTSNPLTGSGKCSQGGNHQWSQ